MKTRLFALLLAIATLSPLAAQDYNHSIGLTVGSLNGFSYKYWATDNFAFQLDLGFQVIETRTSSILVKGPYYNETAKLVKAINYMGGRITPSFLWQNDIADNWNIFLGAGVSADLIRDVNIKNLEYDISDITWESTNKYACKFGINAVLGIEYCFESPFNISLDFRPGYTAAYDNLVGGYRYYLGAFDWNLCLGLRYRIGE